MPLQLLIPPVSDSSSEGDEQYTPSITVVGTRGVRTVHRGITIRSNRGNTRRGKHLSAVMKAFSKTN